MSKGALGKGLSALIPEKADISDDVEKQESVSYLNTEDIRDNALQPRTNYDQEKLDELIASVKEKGILQPILVRDVDGDFEVVAGERRLRAARALGLEKVPAVIRQLSNQEALVIALVENIQREELNPIEEAEAYGRLIEEFNYSQEEVAKSVGKDRSTISNTIRLLKLPINIQKGVEKNKISMGHARALLGIDSERKQEELFAKIAKKGLSVRETENLVKAYLGGTEKKKTKTAKVRSHEIISLEEELQRTLGTKVRIQAQKKRGKVVIEYYSHDDLERILNFIRK